MNRLNDENSRRVGPRTEPRRAPRRRDHDDRLGCRNARRLVSRIALWSTLLSGGGRSRSGNQIVLLEMLTFVVSIVIYVIAFLLTMALSRYRDSRRPLRRSSSASPACSPARSSTSRATWAGSAHRPSQVRGMNAFFFARAGGNTAASLFSTHPSLEKRLDALKKLEVDSTASGLRDTLFGRTKQVAPKLDGLFALRRPRSRSRANWTSSRRATPDSASRPGVARRRSRPMTNHRAAQLRRQTGTVKVTTDDLGFKWLVVTDPELDGLVTRIHGANTMVEHGLGPRCCAVFGFVPKTPPATAPFEWSIS